MFGYRRILFNVILGMATCFFLVGISSPSISKTAPTQVAINLHSLDGKVFLGDRTLQEEALRNEREAEGFLVAQGTMGGEIKRFTAVLKGRNFVPSPADTSAWGSVGAALSGDRLIVRGSFQNLSSALRDYATDPTSPPNPNITSAIHIHRGSPDQNGPFQYALQVTLDSGDRSGTVKGEYNLTPEQLQALANGTLYVDLHTKGNRGGELRGILKA